WLVESQDYKTHEPNRLGSCFVIGLSGLVAAAGGPQLDLTLLGVVLTGLLWWFRRRICEDDVLALLTLISLGIVYAHDLDSVYLAPLAVSLTLHLRGNSLGGVVVAVLVALFFIPSRWICQYGLPVVSQWRTVICLIFLGWLLWLSVRHAALQAGAEGRAVSQNALDSQASHARPGATHEHPPLRPPFGTSREDPPTWRRPWQR